MSDLLRIAHRGASGYEAENSIAALNKAIELNVDIIECDVQLTKDGVPIIRHDKRLDRTTNTEGYTSDFTWSEYCKNIRLKNGEAVSSLQDFCKIVNDSSQKLYVDLKQFDAVEKVLDVCLKYLPHDKLILGSFNAPAIIQSKKIHPQIETALIMEGRPYPVSEIIKYTQCDILALGFDSIDQKSITEAQKLGTKVFSWTINHPDEIAGAKSIGLDGITSDYPDRI